MGTGPTPTPKLASISASTASVSPRPTLDLHSALDSVLRTWLVSRDSALWTFVSGVDEPLADIHLADAEPYVATMKQAREIALSFAKQIAEVEEKPAKVVLYEAVARVLDGPKPKFLLGVEGVEGAF